MELLHWVIVELVTFTILISSRRLQIVRLDNLPVRSLPNKAPVVVEATLYHGATQLCDSRCTTSQPVNGLLRVRETITFNIAKKDVPKVRQDELFR